MAVAQKDEDTLGWPHNQFGAGHRMPAPISTSPTLEIVAVLDV
jgi:hypothetical protein